jgi:hypothetical protein
MGQVDVPAEHHWGAQQEAMVMVCLRVIGEDAIVASAGAQGNFELNAMRPMIINKVLHSARIVDPAKMVGDPRRDLRRLAPATGREGS